MSFSAAFGTEATAPVLSSKAAWLKQARQLHFYLGTFFAPSILFFALTGALQLFGLQEGHPGDAYQPPAWLAQLGSLHKNQAMDERHGPPEFGGGRGGRRQERKSASPTIALKCFFLAASLGLVLTTVLGICMAFKFNRSREMLWSLLISGSAIPAALVGLMG